MNLRSLALSASSLLFAATALAAAIPAPPYIEHMWNGRDAADVRAFLARTAADGEAPTASAEARLDAGDAAWWMSVQDARAGRADSAFAQLRRAMRLRGDFDEAFALVDVLARRGRKADLVEARAIAGDLAQQADLSFVRRSAESHARVAWTLHLLGRSDSALAEVREHAGVLTRRPTWTRRFLDIHLAGGDLPGAWRTAAMVAVRRRGADARVDSLARSLAARMVGGGERFESTVTLGIARAVETERGFAAGLGGTVETLVTKDGFPLQVFVFPAMPGTTRRAPILVTMAASDTITASDSLVAGAIAAGHPVALLAPRGAFGSLARGSYGPEDWMGREYAHRVATTADAAVVMDQLAKRAAFAGGPWIVGAVGEHAPVALELARSRRDVSALLLIAPRVPVVDAAEWRDRLRTVGTPVFVQVSPEEPEALEFGDLIARDTAPGQVRVVDSGEPGRGSAVFRGAPFSVRRFLVWWRDGLPNRR